MRTSRLLIISMLALAACKSTSVTTSSEPYAEDFSHLRNNLSDLQVTETPAVAEEITATKSAASGTPTGHLSAELDSVNQIIISKNKNLRYIDGFTVQVFTGNREAATAALEKVMSLYPQLNSQIEYHQPNYKVKAGQYVDRLKANEIYQNLKKDFPQALLIPERIRVDYE